MTIRRLTTALSRINQEGKSRDELRKKKRHGMRKHLLTPGGSWTGWDLHSGVQRHAVSEGEESKKPDC